MKKRTLIVATMAVAMAALVGCQKDFEPVADFEQANGSAARPELGSVALSIDSQATRVVAGGNGGYNWVWEDGDAVGAMLVDDVKDEVPGHGKFSATGSDFTFTWTYADYVTNPGKKQKKETADGGDGKDYTYASSYVAWDAEARTLTSEDFYTVSEEHIWTNYPYTKDGELFTTPANLVEGHYMFYAPYDANHTKRGPLVVTLPVEQTIGKDGNEAVAEFYKGTNPVVLSQVEFLAAANTKKVETAPQPIFAYPEFTIKNEFDGYLFDGVTNVAVSGGKEYVSTGVADKYTITVKQVEFYAANTDKKPFVYQQAVDPTKLDPCNEEFVEDWVKDPKVYKSAPTASVMAKTSAYAEAVYAAFEDDEDPENVQAFEGIFVDTEKKTQRIVVKLDKELEYGQSTTFNVIMPAYDYTKAELTACILVEIDGVEYYIVDGDKTNIITRTGTSEAYKDFGVIKVTNANAESNYPSDYKFYDRSSRNNEDIILVRGERYPTIEVLEDRSGLKDFHGEMLTIELKGGKTQVAVAAKTEKSNGNGIKTNDDFYNYLNAYVNKGQTAPAEVSEIEWSVNAKLTAENFFFDNKKNEVVINAEFVKRVSAELGKTKLTLKTNLPIANDVVVKGSGTTYTFTTAEAELTIEYTTAVGANATSNKLKKGINVVSSGTELKVDTGVTGAVVFANSNIAVNTATGITGVVVVGTSTNVTFNTATDALINASEGQITLAKGANLTNKLNIIKKAKNNGLATIDGKTVEGVYVDAQNLNLTIPAATKITTINVVPSATFDKNKPFEITQAMLDNLKTLDKLTIAFGTNITFLASETDIEIPTTIKAMNGTASWTTNQGLGITVTIPKNTTVATTITPDAAAQVTFKKLN